MPLTTIKHIRLAFLPSIIEGPSLLLLIVVRGVVDTQ
jgi:hypothetical protein